MKNVPDLFENVGLISLTDGWVENGLVKGKALIKVAAVMGEGPQLRDDEWPALLRTVVQRAKGRATVLCGIHHKDTMRTIDDARRAQDLGAVGLQISPPVFNEPNQDDVLRYFEAVSDAIEIGILIYNNPWFPYGAIYPQTLQKMAGFEHVVAVKWTPPEGVAYEEMQTISHIFNMIDNSSQPVLNHKLGGRGYINLTLEAYPPHDLKVWELLESKQYDKAQELWDSVSIPLRDLYAKFAKRSGGQARLKKGMMAVMGQPAGDCRPPSEPLNDGEMAELRKLLESFGWPVAG